jgi:threonine synthase
MEYLSTRGGGPPIGFQDAVMTGLARDGGLFLPAHIPDVRASLEAWRNLSYRDLAYVIMRLYADLPEQDLRELIDRSFATFRHPEIAPVVPLGDLHLLELFHGPTLAFKDVALQFLGRLFEYVLDRSGRRLNILAATSGDTGGAAIAGVKGRRRMRIFVLYPHGRVSPVQERQMIAMPDANVFTLAVEGSFDDCQNIVKALLGDLPFRDRCALGAVNSINWARLLAQIVYYFYAAFRVMERTGKSRVRFAVPTGNFGDVFAGYLAWRMGLPIGRLVLATNENDILARFFNTGVYRRGRVLPTLSPSMDIQVASNFERYLFYRAGEDPARLRQWMTGFNESGELRVACGPDGAVDPLFAAGSAGTQDCLAVIREYYSLHGYLLDPHSAVGVHVARSFLDPEEPMICLATAHPAKFGEAIRQAVGRELAHHAILDALNGLPVRRTVIPASAQAIRHFIEQTIGADDRSRDNPG